MDRFCDIETRRMLAEFLDIPYGWFTYILYGKKTENLYTSFDIAKKSGGYRHINAPNCELKEIQRKLANALYGYQLELIKENKIQNNISQAFEKDKSFITNACKHRNKRWILNIDLENFFDSFHFGRVLGFFEKNRYFNLPREVASVIAQISCYEGCLPQGAPTSPIITNLICNVLDMRIVKIARKYRMDYTRYADDLTFSTNDKNFVDRYSLFLEEVDAEIQKSGFNINETKTRLFYRDSRQEVTGLVVNNKVNVNRDYYKKTRAMAESLYTRGEFYINGIEGTINQLEGRFSFINQLEWYNNKLKNEKVSYWTLNSREQQYQKFLFYKYFYNNSRPCIITEGKTDVLYIKAALKKYSVQYPELIKSVEEEHSEYNLSFIKRTRRLEYFLGLFANGADAIKNIYDLYTEKGRYPNYYEVLRKKGGVLPTNPVILIFDNEQETERPLKKFLKCLNNKDAKSMKGKTSAHICGNLYLVTNPLVDDKKECEMEDLFDESTLKHVIGGKEFCKKDDFDEKRYYGKNIFSQYVYNNYKTIDLSRFIPLLDDINKIVVQYREQNV